MRFYLHRPREANEDVYVAKAMTKLKTIEKKKLPEEVLVSLAKVVESKLELLRSSIKRGLLCKYSAG